MEDKFKGKKEPWKRVLLVDFDGVIHAYTSKWEGPGIIADGPVNGAILWLKAMLKTDFDMCIYSSRSKHQEGVDAMRRWFGQHGLETTEINQLGFPTEKPPAYLTLDDRCICFTGLFPDYATLNGFKAWNKR